MRIALDVLVLALGARAGVAQAPLTPIDSAILNSQPLKRLVLAPSLFRRLSVPAERAGGRARPRSGAVPAGEHIRGYGGGAGARDAGPGTVHRGRRGARAVRADDARCVAQPS